MDPTFICGAVAILGKPNVGKSTFLNNVLGQKLAIVTPKPQTTRTSMVGLYQEEGCQIVFYDTPGIHQPKNKLAQHMIYSVEEVIKGADAALFLMDALEQITEEDRVVAQWLLGFRKPVWVVLNKMDKVSEAKAQVLEGKIQAELGKWPVLKMAALTGKGVPEILAELKKNLPQQPPLFPDDDLTDKTMREIAAEMIREQCFLLLKQEIPYGVAVMVDKFEEKQAPNPVVIQATIFVEKDSQKGIVIGAKGSMLKEIGTAARVEIEKILDQKVFLELWVKVLKDWRKDEDALKRLGYPMPKSGKKG
jgi:GTPase